MATKKAKAEQEVSVEDKLKSLFKLQSYLSEIDRIKTLRGELPLEVADLDDEIAGLGTRINNFQLEVKQLEENTKLQKGKIETSKAKIEKYNKQLDNVRNSKEYDHLSKEIEFETLEIALSEKHIREFEQEINSIKEQIKEANELLKEKTADLDHKKKELDDIVSETKAKEEKIREKAKKTETTIEPRLLTAFKRIRKNARNGLGVVPIQRGACGGCFNKIPPQKQMDIKLRKKIIVCEYCGRIMIDPDIAGISE
ncbi:C4-type zinc ribbon domain-containing protein [Lascolabacillus sp.]|uniref:zinc ribbon domain-containing protein n=1 Tax=Lascolabacillus sp. TaxID=1924068 RepID=UPI00258834E5|nr:C4-type zinc ribbon domain-containing protein [Lascolabacillus sp.]MDD2606148.1 C4-type zinc ribbon domain-containing protein [Lascolabacillus sp.]